MTNDKETDDEMMLTYFFDDGTTIPIYKTFRRSMALNRYLEEIPRNSNESSKFFFIALLQNSKDDSIRMKGLKADKVLQKTPKN